MSNHKKISDTSSSYLLKGSTIVFGLNAASKIFTTGLKSVISHLLGPAGLGIYELVLALTRFLSTIPQFGLHQTIVQFISVYRTSEAWNQVRAAVQFGLLVVLFFSLLISGALLFGLDTLKNIFFDNEVNIFVIWTIVILIPLFAIKNFLSLSLRGLKNYGQEILYNNTLFPFLVILSVLLIYFSYSTISIEIILIATILSVLISCIGAFISLQKIFISKEVIFEKFNEKKRLLKYSTPVWINTILSTSYSQMDRVLLGLLSSISQVGFYASAYALALLISFVLNSFNPIFQPLIAEAYANRDIRKIKLLYQKVVNWTSYLVFPIVGGIILFGDSVLKLVFGTEFDQAYSILLVLAIAESINALAGPSGNILLMSERQKESAWILGIGFIIGICLNIVLIPYFDAIGAAFGTAVGLITINCLRVYVVRKHFKIVLNYWNQILSIFLVFVASILTYWFNYLFSNIYISIMIYLIITTLLYLYFLNFNIIIKQIYSKINKK